MQNSKKLLTFFCLYIAQTIPMSFFSTVIPVMMRQENFSLSTIGLLQLIKLPWILKFLWSPLVDRSSTTLNGYKKWIFSSELIYASLIFAVSFFDFRLNFHLIFGLIILSFIASATQDIATDALAALSFSSKDKSMVNSMQSMGSFAGTVIGGGLLLLLFNLIGWNTLLPLLALFVCIALLPLLFFKGKGVNKEQMLYRADAKASLTFFTQKTIWKQIGFLFLYYTGLIGTLAMLKPWLVDLGYTIQEIGTMSGVMGTLIGFGCSFSGGLIVKRFGIYRSRIAFATLILCTALYFYLISLLAVPSTAMLYGGIFMLWGSYGLSTIIVYTTAMNCVRKGCEGTDFTIQTVITHFSSMLVAIASGRIADKLGYNGLFLFEIFVALLSLIYIICIFGNEKSRK